MDPVTIGLGIASLVPELLKYFGKGKDADIAGKVIEVASKITGKSSAEESLQELQVNPQAVLDFRKAILDQETELARISASVVIKVNDTIQAEAKADHWPTYTWRPYIGFCFGTYVNSLWILPLFGKSPVIMSPDIVLAIGGILGVASWFRGKMQSDPNVPSDNRG